MIDQRLTIPGASSFLLDGVALRVGVVSVAIASFATALADQDRRRLSCDQKLYASWPQPDLTVPFAIGESAENGSHQIAMSTQMKV